MDIFVKCSYDGVAYMALMEI